MKKFLILAIMVLTLLVPTSVMAANPVSMNTTSVAQVASITVDQSSLNFGTVVVGTDSIPIHIVLTNSGNVPITIAVLISGADSAFYQNSLLLSLTETGGYSAATLWISGYYTTVIPVGGTASIWAKVHPLSIVTGAVGTLTFLATASL